jgi:hypothetical protein
MAKKRALAAPEMDKDEQAKRENSETKAELLPAAPDTVKVKFLRSHPALAYAPGEVADLPRALHDKYLEDGPFYEAVAAEASATEN